ncbi:glycosyltransferase family 2 protein [Aeromonas veronii]|uniref:glycosyltransferase family 2 protein n=1 Tax=Aeromonas veronii TaxID=654 RepID=UPI003B9DEC65
MKKISVITVVYNGALELQATIDSVVAQDYPEIEYVVIDGGSNDGTIALIQKNLSVIDTWISERDNGIYDAMNKGVALASGDFVIFMNAGDRFYSHNAISQCIAGVNNEDVVYGDHWVLGSRRNDGRHIAKPIEQLKYGMVCSHQSMFFRRALLIAQPFSLQYGTAGDYECICRLYRHEAKFKYSKDVIVSYYSAGGVSDVKRCQSIKNTFLATYNNSMLTWSNAIGFLMKYVRAILSGWYFRKGRG